MVLYDHDIKKSYPSQSNLKVNQSLSEPTPSYTTSSLIGAFAPSSKCSTINVHPASRIICAVRESRFSLYPPSAPNKICQARHTDLQGPPSCWHHQLRPYFYAAPLGSPSLPSHPDLEPYPTVNNQSATICGGATQWRLQFKSNPYFTSRKKP